MYIDSHCHLDDGRFQQRQYELVAAAKAAGVAQVVVPSVWPTNWGAVARLVDDIDQVHAAYGLHPWFLQSALDGVREFQLDGLIQQLDDWVSNNRTVAIGECGLDFSRSFSADHRLAQRQLFEAQLALAQCHGLPVIIHAHKALDRVVELLRESSVVGVVHRFDGSLQQARQLVDMGFYIGVAAGITFTNQRRLRGVIGQLPITSLMLETDGPDLVPAGCGASLNEPAFLPQIAAALADLQGCSLMQVAIQTTLNSQGLFGI